MPHLLSTAADDALRNTEVVAVSAMTVWEIAILDRRNRVAIEDDPLSWIRGLEEARGLLVLPITTEVSLRAAELHQSCETQWTASSPPPP